MSDSMVPASPEVRDALTRLLVWRAQVFCVLSLGAAAVFALVNHFASAPPLWADIMNAGIVATLGVALVSTTRPRTQPHIQSLALLLGVAATGTRAWAGVWHGDVAPTAIFLVVMAMTTAATLPWGAWPQLVLAGAAALATAANSYLVTGGFGAPPGHAAAAVALGLAGSVVLAAEMRRHHVQLFVDNLQRRRAEAELARLNSELERRVRERTAQLAATTQDLEREAQERRVAVDELRESQRRLEAVLDHAGVAIFLRDLAGRYLLVNRYWLALAGRSLDEVIGRTVAEIMPPAVAEALQAHDEQVLASPHSLRFEESIPQLDGVHTFVSVKFRWLDRDGTPAGIWGLSTDITEVKQAEAELRRSEAALSAVVENTHDAIWSIDRRRAIRVINGAGRRLFVSRFGVPFEQRERLRVPAGLANEFHDLYERVLSGEHVEVERSYDGQHGREHYLTSLHPIVEGGSIIGATVFSKDISEQKRVEQEVRQRQAELAHVLRLSTMGEMASGLAHEINQPLSAIANYATGCTRRLDAGSLDTDTLRPIIAKIASEALRAGEIIRRLRALVRKEDTRYERTDLNHLVRESAQLIETEARAFEVGLLLDLAPNLPLVSCNDIQIEQVLLNLLRNGVDAVTSAVRGERTLAVTTRASNGQVEVAVCDSGVGIPDPPVDVFAPFYTTKATGLGMGLSISRSIIEAHNGHLWATRNSSYGSTFRFTLPTLSGVGAARTAAVD